MMRPRTLGLVCVALVLATVLAALAALPRPARAADRPLGETIGRRGPAPGEVTDADVTAALEKGKAYLLGLQNPDGSFSHSVRWRNCYTSLILMTLAYMGEHPNRPYMREGFNYLINLEANRAFGGKEGYAVPVRIMALAYLYRHLTAEQRERARQVMTSDLNHIIRGQSGTGGWRYHFDRSDQDFSATQWVLLAMYEASRVGIEFPKEPLLKALKYYHRGQKADGGWPYRLDGPSYGAMTAAGLASLRIIEDLACPASGCPCRGRRSQGTATENDRRIAAALDWLARNFSVRKHPKWPYPATNFDEIYYWLYCLERVGIACGYKHFGRHNWYREGAAFLLGEQRPDGSWQQIDPADREGVTDWAGGRVPDTCFALLFLFKGRAPVLFNKLRFRGVWNPHRCDLANLTRYIQHAKEQLFHWQIVDLAAPIEELHDAPILFISSESSPTFSADERATLRRFTDTGGTILLEASCGNLRVRRWARDLARKVWPEWPLQPLGTDHPVYTDPYPLKERPELMGVDDGMRTVLYVAMDDVSCPWHMRAFAAKDYLFRWGINLFTVATDQAPLRAKLADRAVADAERYADAPKPGPRKNLTLVRLETTGDWHVGANYAPFAGLADHLKETCDLALTVTGPAKAPVTTGGVKATDLAEQDVAYLAGTEAFDLPEAEREALKAWLAGGRFLLAEAAAGSKDFNTAFRALAKACGWTLRPLPADHPIMTGTMGEAKGFDLTSGVRFRRALRIPRAGQDRADLVGVWAGDRLAGVYSPLDLGFSLNPYEAWAIRGYEPADARAVATNLLVYLSARP
ncbi:MAG: DUF4159 domain-containing protein [Phycisphaerae bacterium]